MHKPTQVDLSFTNSENAMPECADPAFVWMSIGEVALPRRVHSSGRPSRPSRPSLRRVDTELTIRHSPPRLSFSRLPLPHPLSPMSTRALAQAIACSTSEAFLGTGHNERDSPTELLTVLAGHPNPPPHEQTMGFVFSWGGCLVSSKPSTIPMYLAP